jgi:hypothetical protein
VFGVYVARALSPRAKCDTSLLVDANDSGDEQGRSLVCMELHWRFLVALFGLILLGFVSGLALDSIAIALGSLVAGLVVAFVFATAFLRADGHSPEHHANVDRVFDDMNP